MTLWVCDARPATRLQPRANAKLISFSISSSRLTLTTAMGATRQRRSRIQVAARLPANCGRQGATAFHQFRTLEVQRLGQQFSDRSGLHNECVDLGDFLGRELAPALGRGAAVDPA